MLLAVTSMKLIVHQAMDSFPVTRPRTLRKQTRMPGETHVTRQRVVVLQATTYYEGNLLDQCNYFGF